MDSVSGTPDERNLAGVIARRVYRHTDSLVRVYDTDGNLLGSTPLRPGDSAEVAAKRLLREKGAGAIFTGQFRIPAVRCINEKGRCFSSGGLEPRIIMSIPIKTS
jgi:hypothetical protein